VTDEKRRLREEITPDATLCSRTAHAEAPRHPDPLEALGRTSGHSTASSTWHAVGSAKRGPSRQTTEGRPAGRGPRVKRSPWRVRAWLDRRALPGVWGIPRAQTRRPSRPTAAGVDFVIMPGVVFDPQGHRSGTQGVSTTSASPAEPPSGEGGARLRDPDVPAPRPRPRRAHGLHPHRGRAIDCSRVRLATPRAVRSATFSRLRSALLRGQVFGDGARPWPEEAARPGRSQEPSSAAPGCPVQATRLELPTHDSGLGTFCRS